MRKFKNDRNLMLEVVVHATTKAIINQHHEITADQKFMQNLTCMICRKLIK